MNIYDGLKQIQLLEETIKSLTSIIESQVLIIKANRFSHKELEAMTTTVETLRNTKLKLEAEYLQECLTSTNPDNYSSEELMDMGYDIT